MKESAALKYEEPEFIAKSKTVTGKFTNAADAYFQMPPIRVAANENPETWGDFAAKHGIPSLFAGDAFKRLGYMQITYKADGKWRTEKGRIEGDATSSINFRNLAGELIKISISAVRRKNGKLDIKVVEVNEKDFEKAQARFIKEEIQEAKRKEAAENPTKTQRVMKTVKAVAKWLTTLED